MLIGRLLGGFQEVIRINSVVGLFDLIAITIVLFRKLLILVIGLKRIKVSLGLLQSIHSALSHAEAYYSDSHQDGEDYNSTDAKNPYSALTVLFESFLYVE